MLWYTAFMIYLSREQCRAARGLLNWTQQDLASHTGLSKTSINNFERGLSNVKIDTLSLIHKALTNEGLIFFDNDGLQRHKESLNVFQGNQALNKVFDDVINQNTNVIDSVLICADPDTAADNHFNNGLQRLKKHDIPVDLYQDASCQIAGLTSFCYGFKLAFYYTNPPVSFIIESPHAQRAEKCRLQRAENTIK